MKFGLTPAQYNFITKNIVEPLEFFGAEVYCYGSRARGTHAKFSDLDLMVEPVLVTKNAEIESKINEMLEFLVNSNFPYKVDLVLHHQFADSYKPTYEKDKVKWRSTGL